MKQSDIISLVFVAILGMGVAVWACNVLLGNPDDEIVTFKTVEKIESGLGAPDPDVFNANAINPTVEVYVGSCVDADRDGVLSDAELAACNEIESE